MYKTDCSKPFHSNLHGYTDFKGKTYFKLVYGNFKLKWRLKMLCLFLLGQNCLHLNHIKAAKPTPVNMRNCQILFMHVNILQKNVFVENVWPAKLAFKLFDYVSTHCVETVKSIFSVDSVVQW